MKLKQFIDNFTATTLAVLVHVALLGILVLSFNWSGSSAPSSSKVEPVKAMVVDESLVCISVNGEELATFMCSPRDLREMAVGFLYNESLIDGPEAIRSIHLSKQNSCVDVWLKRGDLNLPQRKIITAGCGGGLTRPCS